MIQELKQLWQEYSEQKDKERDDYVKRLIETGGNSDIMNDLAGKRTFVDFMDFISKK